ncbi:5238_t:CDS:2 [Acaulospora colombiana]|uniref:5238_t:CDS:1 n=1 Tax=Acaulospora colombiana TaxID=27376 RepID=A0ACA9KYP7_9GLOM|nr:5238_t:CDS:2 [Acaulospora colombiana]
MTSHTEKNTAEEDSDIIEFLNRKLANLSVVSDATEVLGKNDDGLPVCEVSMLLPQYAHAVYNALHSPVRQLRLAAVAGSTKHTEALVAGDVTRHLIKVLSTSTNIEVQTQVNAVLTEPNLMENVVALLWDSDMKVVKEACWVLSNSTSLHDPDILVPHKFSIILQHDIISPLLHHLRNPSTPHEILNKILDTLVNILSVGDLSGCEASPESHNEYARKLAVAGVVEALIETWNNTGLVENIKEKVRGLLERWFYDYLPRNEHNGEVGDDGIDISSIEERVSRMTIMEGVDVF